MKRQLHETKNALDQSGRGMRLEYYLLAEPEAYGIEVALYRGAAAETCAVPGITPSAARADALLCTLAAATVTPCGLHDALAELL